MSELTQNLKLKTHNSSSTPHSPLPTPHSPFFFPSVIKKTLDSRLAIA
ncbi:hypothetical protein K9N68_29940 [Kovacikia minuta CCNUW1]|nr:hypothetical protein [Kovacikia minuta]UBF25727.1 hypothetical protein K9N68_29940 [Kovacikia minuta CCNUW1]